MNVQPLIIFSFSLAGGFMLFRMCRKPQPKMGDMTLEELAAIYKTDGRLLIGCKSKIYDVSSNEMYAPGQGYNCFVGKDASVALGKMQFNPEYLDPSQLHWSKDLNKEETKILDDWAKKFDGKYTIVGRILDDLKNN
jgi:predicted heme/steroid binding protein